MGERLASGNHAIALLANGLATGDLRQAATLGHSQCPAKDVGCLAVKKEIFADYVRVREQSRALVHQAQNHRLASQLLCKQAGRMLAAISARRKAPA